MIECSALRSLIPVVPESVMSMSELRLGDSICGCTFQLEQNTRTRGKRFIRGRVILCHVKAAEKRKFSYPTAEMLLRVLR